MKNKKIILFMLFLAGAAFFAVFLVNEGKSKKEIAVGLSAPVFELKDAGSGRKISSSDLKGKVIFLNFWASWCQPCRDEMPSIEALYKEMLFNNDFVMVTVLYKDSPASGLEYMKSNGYTFPVFSDPDDGSARNFGVTGVPETYIIDKKGILRKRVIGGADWNSPEEKSLIKALLNE